MTSTEAFELYLNQGYDDLMDFRTYCFNVLGIDFDEEEE